MRLLTFLLLIAILYSCTNNDIKPSGPERNLADSLKQSFLPIIKGTWVESTYLEDIEKTKSPVKSAGKVSIITVSVPEKATGDSIEMMVGNTHEGWSYILHLAKGRTPNTFATSLPDSNEPQGTDIGYEITGQDTSLLMYRYEANKLSNKIRFIRVDNEAVKDNWYYGLPYAVNQRLFTGNYTFTDSTGQAIRVRFNSNGTVKGLPDSKNYYISTDLEGIEKEDIVSFDNGTKVRRDYAFEIKDNRISLYDVIRKGEEVPAERSDLRYQLIRE
jgi:hypothetical protein